MKSYYSILFAVFLLLIVTITIIYKFGNLSNENIIVKDSAITHPASWT